MATPAVNPGRLKASAVILDLSAVLAALLCMVHTTTSTPCGFGVSLLLLGVVFDDSCRE